MKLNKLTKKIMLGAIPLVGIAGPVMGTISCGGGQSGKADLVIGIRPEDQALWNKVGAEFTKATGKTVKFKWVYDQNQNYSLWSQTKNAMPDVTIADSGWAKTGMDRGWFQPLDLKSLAEDPKNMITGQDEEYKETPLTFDTNHFSMAMMETMKTSDKGYNGLAVIYGPKLSYTWRKIPKGNGQYLDLYDGQTPLKWYVPKKTGGVEEVADYSAQTATWQTSPLFSRKAADHHRLKNTLDDVQEFLSNAASMDDLKFNNPTYTAANLTGAPSARVISTGMLGYSQRLASVSKVIYDIAMGHADTTPNVNKIKIGVAKDAAIDWMVLAYGDKVHQNDATKFQAAPTNMDGNVLNDNKVFSKGPDPIKWDFATKHGNTGESHYQILSYLGQLGYFQKGIFGTSKALEGADLQVGFAGLKSLMINDGALWQWGGIKDKIEDTFKGESADNLLTSFGKPFQNTGVDGYALTRTVSGERKDLALKFLRFLMQKRASADITGNKAVSTMVAAHEFQEPAEGARKYGLEHAGVKANYVNNPMTGISFELAKSSNATGNLNGHDNSPIYDPYNEFWMQGHYFDTIDYTADAGMTYDIFKGGLDTYNASYMDKIAALG